MIDDLIKKIDDVAGQILNLARNSLIVNLRFMDTAISMLKTNPTDITDTVMVDGNNIYYNPEFLLKSYKKGKEWTARQYLHMIMHCVFQHYDIGRGVDRDCWNLACDIAVESVINSLNIDCVKIPQAAYQRVEETFLEKNVIALTAEVLYRHLKDGNVSERDMETLRKVFTIDSHEIWYKKGENIDMPGTDNSLDDWKSVAEHIAMDMETFSKGMGYGAGNMLQNLREVTRERYDYEEFLKKFAVSNEVMKVNDDEFDYIFYTYGLQKYGNIPLIEPLEYKEIKQIKEFVIVIDTSGSTSGDLVQTFINKTYNILKQQESFAARINLYIIQCDANIQEAINITNQNDFDRYLKNFAIKGLGGTDFRPAFEYVDSLIEEKKFNNLKGMLYFTDGYGIFPQKAPEYDTAFVFIEDNGVFNNYDVPAWAMKLILKKDDIEGIR